ncbi:MAG TPA: hypothetical protein VIU61_00425 [Kofleriaceae bacterium]
MTMRLLARELPQRYQTATDVMVDLIACRDYPRSGRELLRGLMKTRLVGESDAGLSSVRTAVDPRRPLPSPSDGRSPQGEVAHQARRSSRSVLLLILAVGILGAAVGLFIASRFNPSMRIVSSAVPTDASTASPQVVIDANPQFGAADPSTAVNAVDGSVQENLDARPASSPTRIAKRQTTQEVAREPSKAPPVEAAPPPSPSPPSSTPGAAKGATKLDEDFARIEKMGISLDFKKLWSHKAPVDPTAVIKYWVGKAPQFRRCYIEGLKALRVESKSGEVVWMYGGSAISYEIDAQGVLSDVRGFSWIHDEITQCMERLFAGATGIPRPASGFAMITVDVDMTTCNAVWELDDKAGRQRRRCPVTTISATGASN